MGDLTRMLNPKTVACIGATEKDGSIGRVVLTNLLSGDGHKVFPVNPGVESVFDRACYKTVADIEEHVDLAVIVTPAQTVPGIVEECGKAGVDGAIIISAGFKEIGDEGKRLEEQIAAIRRHYGMRIMGPNCVGVIRPKVALNTTFFRLSPEPGNIAFLSQSGALGSAILDWAASNHLGFSMFASLGSMIDIDFGDLIDFLGDDQGTRSIIIYMEGVGNARKFMSAARGFARNKPIVVVKPGRFNESARAALSHTGALAGDDAVYDVALKRVGVVRVAEIADLFNAAEVLDSKNLPRGPNLAIITNAGGPGVMTTDTLIERGGKLAQLLPESIEGLNAVLPSFWSKGNPVDVLGDADVDRYVAAMKICLHDPNVDGVLIVYAPQERANPTELAQAIIDEMKSAWKPVITAWMGADFVREARSLFIANRIPTYATPEEAVKTYLHMYRYKRNLELLYETPAELPVDEAPPKNHLKAFVRRAMSEGKVILTEEESKDFLLNYQIPVTAPFLVRDVTEAVFRANRIGYPVVLKIVSPDITHKTDVGGVTTGIRSADELRDAYAQMMNRVRMKAPEAHISGATVQQMIEAIDYELILGAKKDKDFGAVILFGMGGIGTEIFHDVSIGIPPLNQTLARRLMERTAVYRMLQGFRGKEPASLVELEQIIVSFSNLIVDFPEIAEMDINPLAISKGKAYALDARIILEKSPQDYTTPYPHLVITPYPTRYVTTWRMRDGTDVLLRPIRPEDEPLEHEMLSRLSPETLRVRFFSVIKDIGHEMLVRFCNIDYDRQMAIVAETKEGGERRIIGIARIIADSDMRSAEFAVLVSDECQGKGLGYNLVDLLIGIAQDKGLERIYGEVLTENEKMLLMCRKLGFTTKLAPDGITEVVLKLK
jgi:acetyltransferase